MSEKHPAVQLSHHQSSVGLGLSLVLLSSLLVPVGTAQAQDAAPAAPESTAAPESASSAPAAAAPAAAAPPAASSSAPAAAAPAASGSTSAGGSAENGLPDKGAPIKLSPPPTGRNALGFSVGMASGMGLSYRRYLTDQVALRVDTFVMTVGGNAIYSFGLSAHEDLFRTMHYKIYALQGVAVHKLNPDTSWLAPGAGLGYEYNPQGLVRGFGLRGELVLTAAFNTATGLTLLTPLPQVGAAFVF